MCDVTPLWLISMAPKVEIAIQSRSSMFLVTVTCFLQYPLRNTDKAFSFVSISSGFVVLTWCDINYECTSKELFKRCLIIFYQECFSMVIKCELFYAFHG